MSDPNNPFRRNGPVNVVGHRGAAGVAPENTLPAFEHAVDVGVDAVEFDLQCTRDGVLVVIHDSKVNRVTDAEGAIEDLTYDDIKQLDAGYNFRPEGQEEHPYRGQGVRIPRLEEVLDVTEDVPMIVEAKSQRAGKRLGEWLRKTQRGSRARSRMIVGAFSNETLKPAREEAHWSCASQDDLRWYVLSHKIGFGRYFAPEDPNALMLPPYYQDFLPILTPSFVDRANRDGFGVYAWTINEAERMRNLYEIGVDGILSDYPKRLKRVYESMDG
ncbi:MAG: glycerophosphodiester phosphodiesterase [bacterium]